MFATHLIICVSETWFDEDLCYSSTNIKNYKLIRNDRPGRRGGGVAIFCKDIFSMKLLSKSADSDIEYLIVEVSHKKFQTVVSCVYNPHRTNVVKPFFDVISLYVVKYNSVIVCGDFNVNLLVNDSYTNNLLDNLSSCSLSVVNRSLPTRFAVNCTPSLLDYFIILDLTTVLKFDQLTFISDHDLIFCCLDINIDRCCINKTISFRDYRFVNTNLLLSELYCVDWSECWIYPSTDEKLDFLMGILKSAFERHVPIRTITNKSMSCPWFTSKSLKSIKLRNKLHSIWKKKPTLENWNAFKSARNRATLVIRNEKRAYFNKKLNSGLSTKVLWRNIKRLGVHCKENVECSLEANVVNDAFLLNCVPHSDTINFMSRDDLLFRDDCFLFSAVSEYDVAMSIFKISSNAIGHDGLPIKFIKIILPCILGTLTHIINHCITTSCFPEQWKIGTVLPVAKKNRPCSPSDFRPISVLPVLSKVFEMLLAKQINEFVSKHNLISPFQSGFRKNHSCSTAVLKISDDIRSNMDENKFTLLCLLDFSKAFDMVNHELLSCKLKAYFGFSCSALKLVKSYLVDRFQFVKIGEDTSQLKPVTSGVPQGSILGPLLFSIFINDIFSVCKFSNLHGYADDIQLYLSAPFDQAKELCKSINTDLADISCWAAASGLILNKNKCFVLPISARKLTNLDFLPPIFIDNYPLKLVSKIKNLGYIINSNLTCTDHVNSIVSKVYLILRNLRQSAIYTPTATRRRLAIQIILPVIMYSEVVYSKHDSFSARKIDVMFNNVTRYVFGLSKYEHISSWKDQILGCTIADYHKARNCIFLCKLIMTQSPSYLFSKLSFTRSARVGNIIIPFHRSQQSSRLFFVNASRLWNSLPANLRRKLNRSNFKNHIYMHFKGQISNID
uniref:Putative RNA-directed DNA polymerase from transposon X-element n=3 Tax=Ceratitis capitata TaxID=7213 RepID=W8B6W6_CERCA